MKIQNEFMGCFCLCLEEQCVFKSHVFTNAIDAVSLIIKTLQYSMMLVADFGNLGRDSPENSVAEDRSGKISYGFIITAPRS